MNRNDFMNFLKTIDVADLEKTPSYVTVKRLHAELCSVGFSTEDANRMMSYIKIDVDEHFINDEELFNYAIKVYANAAFKMCQVFEKVSPGLFWELIRSNAMSLTYKRTN